MRSASISIHAACSFSTAPARKIATCRIGEHEIKVVVPPEQPIPSERGVLEFNPAMTRLYSDGRLVG